MTLKYLFQNKLFDQPESWFKGFKKKTFITGLKRVQDKGDIEIIKFCVAPSEYFKKERTHLIFEANITNNKDTGLWEAKV